VVAPTCLLADALTKVLVQVGNSGTSYFAQFGATAFVTSGDVIEGRAT
jgi:thiamine biosynthesis lipoprotein